MQEISLEIHLVGIPTGTNWHYLGHCKGINNLILGESTVLYPRFKPGRISLGNK